MTQWLKQSTAFTFRIGPFVDDTDGKTAETALSIVQANIQISKNGGAFAQTSAASPTTTHDVNGWYQCPLTATDTGTLGPLEVQVAISGALPVWKHFMVMPANIFDSLVSGSAADYLDVSIVQLAGSAIDQAAGLINANVKQISGDATAADNLEATFDGTGYANANAPATQGALTTIDDFLDTEVAAILAAVDTEVAAIKTKTDYLPSATAGAAGGLFIAGANAAMSVATALTANITGNLSGSVGSVTGAVESVTGAVGSVTGNVGGNVAGSVGSVALGGITAASIATGAIDADALAADAVDEILDEVVEGTLTLRQVLRLLLAKAALKVSGGGTTTVSFRDVGDTKDRIVMTVDEVGDRSAVTLDGS